VKIGYINDSLHLELQLDDGAVGKYPVVLLYNESNTLLDSIQMGPGNAEGTYVTQYTPLVEGYLYFVYKVYTSNLYNVLDPAYTIGFESALIYGTDPGPAAVAAAVWAAPVRGLTEAVAVNNIDISQLATKTDLDNLKVELIAGFETWEAKGSLSLNPVTNILEMVAWLTKNGEVVLDPNSATIELRDGDDNIIIAPITDNTVSATGLFKFTQTGASGIIYKNRTYVMRVTITRGSATFHGNVSISSY